jgi:hypothetical protein
VARYRNCIPDKPYNKLDAKEQNKYVHAMLYELGSDWTGGIGNMFHDIVAMSKQAWTDAGLSPSKQMQMLKEVWSKLRSTVGDISILGNIEGLPHDMDWFFNRYKQFIDKNGVLDEVLLMREVHKSPRFQRLYGRYRKLAASYLDFRSTHPEAPMEDANAYLATIFGHDRPAAMGSTIKQPLKKNSWVSDYGMGWGKIKSTFAWAEDMLTGSRLGAFLPTKEVMRKLGKKFGREYSRIWEQGEGRRVRFDEDLADAYEQARQSVGTQFLQDINFRERVTYIRENAHNNPGHEMWDIFQLHPPSSEELKAAARIGKFMDEWGKRAGIPEAIWEPNYMMRVRKFGTFDPEITGKAGKGDLPFLRMTQMLERTGQLNPREADSLLIMQQYAKTVLKFKTFAEDGWYENAKRLLKRLDTPETKQEWNYLYHYLEDITANITERTIHKLESARKIGSFLSKLTGGRLTEDQGMLFPQLLSKTQLAGAIGFRGVPILKQAAQLHLVGGAFLGRYLFKGMRIAMEKDIWRYAKEIDLPLKNLGNVGLEKGLEGALGRSGYGLLKRYDKWMNLALKPYFKADEINRMVCFAGGKSMLEDAVHDFWAGKIDAAKFQRRVKYRWFDGFHDLQDTMNEALARKGDTEFLRKLGDKYGWHVAEDINYVYRPGNTALVARQHPIALQFATWPSNFSAYMMRHLEYAAKTGDVRGVGTLIGMGAGLYALGENTGLDLRSLYGYSSLGYKGGPILGMAGDTLDYLKNAYYGSDMNNVSLANFTRDLSLFVPAGLALHQFITGTGEGDLAEAFGMRNLISDKGGSGFNFFQ